MVLAMLFCACNVYAGSEPYGPQDKRFGAGIVVGEPTGISLKGYIVRNLSIGTIGAWSFNDEALTLIGDVLYDFFDIKTKENRISLPFYAGVGAKIAVGSDKNGSHNETIFGIRVPVGIAAQWKKYPIEVFAEIAPGIDVVPDTSFDLSGGVGIRWYFF